MKKATLFFALSLLLGANSNAQNVGVGTITPRAKLEVNSPTVNPAIFNGISPMYMSIYEDNIYRGYWGSYSGAPEDVDFGTGVGTLGKLHLTTGASPKLTINSSGDVGIGTVNPNHRLHVYGGDMFLQSSSGKFRFGYDGSDQWGLSTTGGGKHLLWTTSTDGVNSTYQHYFAQNGNVGIGTGLTSPAARLHVSTTSSEVIRLSGNRPYLSFYDNTDGYRGYLWYDGSNIVLGAVSSNLKLSGNVVLGTTPAVGYRLSVDGKAIFEEARVQLSTSWPDYVFNEGYQLQSLSDLEKSIIKNKHLPNMPPASEVEANGFDLGDMNKRLVEKVEELTLYIIKLDKEKNALEARMNKMENLIAEKK